MITALLIDDEKNSRESLRKKIETYCPTIQIIGECANGIEGLESILQRNPDIVFLDIEMPHMNGFTMLQQIPEKRFSLIFTTAYNQYAINAIRHSALDYLIKPVDINELIKAVQRAENSRLNNPQQIQISLLEQLLQNQQQPRQLAVATASGLEIIAMEKIIYLEAVGNYTNLHVENDRPLLASKTLKEFEEILPAEQFFRIHNASLVNIAAIKKYLKGDGGQVLLNNGLALDVARRRKDELIELLLKFSKRI